MGCFKVFYIIILLYGGGCQFVLSDVDGGMYKILLLLEEKKFIIVYVSKGRVETFVFYRGNAWKKLKFLIKILDGIGRNFYVSEDEKI